jgi:hypothetical protein
MADEDRTIPLSNVVTIDDERIRGHLDRVVRGTVEETLNALLGVYCISTRHHQLVRGCVQLANCVHGQCTDSCSVPPVLWCGMRCSISVYL